MYLLSFIHTITPRLVASSVILSFSFLPATARFLTWIPFLILESFSHFQNPITTPHLEVHQVKGIRYSMSTFLGSSVPYKSSSLPFLPHAQTSEAVSSRSRSISPPPTIIAFTLPPSSPSAPARIFPESSSPLKTSSRRTSRGSSHSTSASF